MRRSNTPTILAAYAPELAFLKEQGLRAEAIGVGLLAATEGMQRVLNETTGPLLLIGTAGVYAPNGIAIGDVVTASRTRLVSFGQEIPSAPEFGVTPVAGFRQVMVNTTLGITTDDAIAAKLGANDCVEHMETYAAVRAAAHANRSLGVLLGITNHVGSSGREQWQKNEPDLAAKLAREAMQWLSELLAKS
jgi:hypothetical protein